MDRGLRFWIEANRLMSHVPGITCLTVTQDDRRFELLTRSIRCFCRQTYPCKALLIVSDGSRKYAHRIDEWLDGLGRDDIRHVYVPGRRRLGEARNLSVAYAEGHYLCQWDDDDLNHPQRLEMQFADMNEKGADASLMEDQLQFFYDTGELLWLSWNPDLIPGTLLCRRECLERHPYQKLSRGEDACIREILRKRENLATLSGLGYLNVYTYSGLNVYPRRHHRQIRFSHDPGFVTGRLGILERELPAYGMSLSDVTIVGAGGKRTARLSSQLLRSVRKRYHWARNRLYAGRGPLPRANRRAASSGR